MPSTLLIGFGNVLRGDDGVGCRVAEALGERPWRRDLRVVAAHQLLPEHVDLVESADHVVFVDAAVDVPPGEIVVTALAPPDDAGAAPPAQMDFHHLTPLALLMACGALHGRAPRATLVRVGGASFDTSTDLSPVVSGRFEDCCALIRDLLSR